MPRLRSALASLLLLAAIPACATQRRLFLMSPFGGDEPPSPDRINLWPLIYKDHDRASVLWPIFDVDDQGWSVRPLVSKDGKDLDILWPLAHADLESGDFWALIAYRDGHSAGLFPLASWDGESGTWRVLTAYHYERSSGLFPLVGWGDLDYLGPFWRSGSEKHQYDLGGLFPLVWVTRHADVVFVIPVYAQVGDLKDFKVFSLLPTVYWSHKDADDSGCSMVFPLWWSTTDGTKHRILTPLGGRGWDSQSGDGFVNVVGPLFHYDRTGDEKLAAFLWPIFEWQSRPVGSSWRIWPLFTHSPLATERSPLDYVTIAEHRSDDVESHFRLFPLYSGQHGGGVSRDELLFGLERHERRRKGDDVAEAWRLWPLFSTTDRDGLDDFVDSITLLGWHPHPDKTHWHVGTSMLAGFDSWGRPRDSWQLRLATVMTVGKETERCKTQEGTRTIVRKHGGALFEWGKNERSEVTEPDGSQHTDVHHRVPLLWEYEKNQAMREWDVLLWCVNSRESKDDSEFHVLWKVYETERHGDRVSRNVFPFITWDSAPDESHFSFLWRLWHYEHKGGKSGGHLLFIPWGESID